MMLGFNWLSTVFSGEKTLSKTADAIISTGDKLFYTDEEKADMKANYVKQIPGLMDAYKPFKIAQRVLAFWFSFLFGISFLAGVGLILSNIIIKRNALADGIPVDKIAYFDIQPLFDLISTFNMGWIMMTIIAFYFSGGMINSMKGK